jgi:hypothetical protein
MQAAHEETLPCTGNVEYFEAAAKLCDAMPAIETFLDVWRAAGGCGSAGCEDAPAGEGSCSTCGAYQRLREALK